jgi:hypothetical protein
VLEPRHAALDVGGLLIMMGQHDRSEALFYYFRLEDQIPETHLLRLIEKHISFAFVREKLGHGPKNVRMFDLGQCFSIVDEGHAELRWWTVRSVLCGDADNRVAERRNAPTTQIGGAGAQGGHRRASGED